MEEARAVTSYIAWAIETSRDGEQWRFFGKAWTQLVESLLLHAVPRLLRFRRLDTEALWSWAGCVPTAY